MLQDISFAIYNSISFVALVNYIYAIYDDALYVC